MAEIHDSIYLLIRLLLCVTWVVAFIQKTMNYNLVLENWRKDKTPFLPYSLYLALGVELIGSIMVIFDFYAWLAALVWIGFIFGVFKFTINWGRTEREPLPQSIQVAAKNISLIGGLIALIAFDKTRPDWLTNLLFA